MWAPYVGHSGTLSIVSHFVHQKMRPNGFRRARILNQFKYATAISWFFWGGTQNILYVMMFNGRGFSVWTKQLWIFQQSKQGDDHPNTVIILLRYSSSQFILNKTLTYIGLCCDPAGFFLLSWKKYNPITQNGAN